jgi:hypothetical protein
LQLLDFLDQPSNGVIYHNGFYLFPLSAGETTEHKRLLATLASACSFADSMVQKPCFAMKEDDMYTPADC